ncbi:Uncharacterized protein HZ326_19859 [Fusarium oxysporum f. sp. albedinis]|nr:Uncharacterized protein HZ326_26583 [Fusarium oxysporum f. sp. albedinis]KAJ0137147.1 Uncharacterized protein HZ326_19859 [Fusarium oxysporum f. sp. albedinis]
MTQSNPDLSDFPRAWVSAAILNRSGQQLFPVEDASDRESYHVLTSTLKRTGDCADHCAYMVDFFHPPLSLQISRSGDHETSHSFRSH